MEPYKCTKAGPKVGKKPFLIFHYMLILVPFQNQFYVFEVHFVVDPSVFVDASGYKNDL